MRTHAMVESPVGPLTLVDEDGALAGLYMDLQKHRPDASLHGPRDDAVQPGLREQLAAYFAGELRDFDVPLRLAGTPFQQRVWAALREIPYGETWSYGRLAGHLASPGASRAVGLANGKNPIGIVVPCHRVVGANGKLVGYGGGLDRKRWLLDHERAHLWV